MLNFKKIQLSILITVSTVFIHSCGSYTGGILSGESGITLSGIIASNSFMAAKIKENRHSSLSEYTTAAADNGTMSVSLSDLEIYVIYFSGSDVGVVKAQINATTGVWSFKVPSGAQINAIVRDKTNLEPVGPITFVDSNNKDMSGNDKENTTYSFKKGASLGTVQLSSDGKFKVDATNSEVAQAANVVDKAPASVVEFSGSWTLSPYIGTLPAGYSSSCAPSDTNCHGPTSGEPIYLIKLVGKKFSYTGGNCSTRKTDGVTACSTTDGQVGTDDIHAAQIWGGGAAIQSCGFKVGFSDDDARAFGHISISPSGLSTISGTGVTSATQLSFGRVTFAVPTGYGTNGGDSAPNHLAWMKGAATSNWDIMDCTAVAKTGTDSKIYNLNVCKGNLHTAGIPGYQAMGPGGCTDDATGKPVIIKNWTALNGITPNCGNSGPSAHPALANMYVNSCSYTGVTSAAASSASFTCTNVFGTFASAAMTTPITNDYIDSFSKVNSGSTCSSIPDDLQRYKCYANAYFQDSNRDNSGCTTDYRFNWNASSIADFVVKDGSRDKPKQQYLTSIVDYSPDGKSFTLEDEQGESVSVQVGTSSIVCRVSNRMILKVTSLSANKLLVDLTQSALLKDTTVAACVGEKQNSTANSGQGSELYRRLQEGNSKFLFYLTK